MILRILDDDELGLMSPAVRRQVRKHLDAGGPLSELPSVVANANVAKKRVHRPEEEAGRLLVTWIDLLVLPNGLRPGLFFMHTPNGLARNATEGGIFKAQGLRKGWPDYSLDLPLGIYHGLRLELKAPDGDKPSSDQLDILARLESVGFKCCVAWGFDEARKYIEQYLDIAH